METIKTTDISEERVDKSKMLYYTSQASHPAEFLSCGNLVSDGGFLHQRRCIDACVLILVCRGTLHINQNGKNLDVHQNETLLLFPHQVHYGLCPQPRPSFLLLGPFSYDRSPEQNPDFKRTSKIPKRPEQFFTFSPFPGGRILYPS